MLDLADRLLGEIDRSVEVVAAPPIDMVGDDIADDKASRAPPMFPDPSGRREPDPRRRRQRVEPRSAVAPAGARRLLGDGRAKAGQWHSRSTAAGGFDLVLLDLMMPGMSGFEVLCRLKADAATRHLPVIMISALDELDSTVRCIEAGAEDYLPKPFNPGAAARAHRRLPRKKAAARRGCSARKGALRGSASQYPAAHDCRAHAAGRDRDRRPRRRGHYPLFRSGRFHLAGRPSSPEETVALLGDVFSRFDDLAARYGLEKIKTIGDGYMVAGGFPEARTDHAAAVAEMALAMLDADRDRRSDRREPLQLRIGLNTGALSPACSAPTNSSMMSGAIP